MQKGDASWPRKKKILICYIDIEAHLLRLSEARAAKVHDAIPASAQICSLRKWPRLLSLLRSITPVVAGSQGMFIRFQHALIVAKSRRVPLTSTMHDILHTWGRLLASLERRITHLREIPPFPPSWFGAADASGTGMGGVCQYNSGQLFVWHAPFSAAI